MSIFKRCASGAVCILPVPLLSSFSRCYVRSSWALLAGTGRKGQGKRKGDELSGYANRTVQNQASAVAEPSTAHLAYAAVSRLVLE